MRGKDHNKTSFALRGYLGSDGGCMERNMIIIGIIGGIGLGILICCEFCGSTMTIIGGILLVFAMVSMVYLKFKDT